ncbi:hypothetical protein [Nonomuraea roseola]|uniref:hypothetical protein n=1 Tax=Nonomuraea roseola TaxID=46179 RepID=UPI0031F89EF0
MFDAGFELEDAAAADETLYCLVRAAERARETGRFRDDVDPMELATQSWAIGHGLASLVATGPLPRQALAHGVPLLAALFVSAGDDPGRCRRSIEQGWKAVSPGLGRAPVTFGPLADRARQVARRQRDATGRSTEADGCAPAGP